MSQIPQEILCPNCKGGNAQAANVCQWCGTPLRAGAPMQYTPPPQQVAVQQKRSGCSTALIVGLIVVALFIGAAYITGRTNPTPNSTITNQPRANQPATAARATPTTVQIVEAPSFTEIGAAKKDMTDAQWDAYAATLKGKHITDWVGVVQNVDNKAFSEKDYVVSLDVTEPQGVTAAFDVKIDVKQEEALKIAKGQTMTVSGTIRQVNCVITYCPVELDSATYTLK